MRPLWLVAAFLGCGGGSTPSTKMPDDPVGTPSEFADDDRFVPAYGKSELARALERERGAEASAESAVSTLEARDASADQLRVARADLAVRRRFIASLETCEATGVRCPPRLDDPPWDYDPDPDAPHATAPPVSSQLRFDVDSWRTLAAELHGRACACRTLACVDSMAVAIGHLETRPMPQVQGDEVASRSITRARECLFRLRGKVTARP